MASSGEPKVAERESNEEAVGFGKPTADATAVHLPSIDLKKGDIVFDDLIGNPNLLPILPFKIHFSIEIDGRKVSGLIPNAGTIHADGSGTLTIPVALVYDYIKNTCDDIKPGMVIHYAVKIEISVKVPFYGWFSVLKKEKSGVISVPFMLDMDVEKIHFEKFSFEETIASLHLKLENKNDFDLGLNALDYEFWLSEISIASAKFNKTITIGKNGVARMEIPISFRPKDFGSVPWDTIKGRSTGYSMKGSIDADTPFGHMNLPISKEGGTTRLKKGDDDDEEE